MALPDPRSRAELDGGPLPTGTPRVLADFLVGAARTGGSNGVRLIGRPVEIHRTYAELLDEASRVLSGIRASGLRPGARVLVQTSDDMDLLTVVWACLLGGFVPVPVSAQAPPGATSSPSRLLKEVWDALDGPAVLAGGGCRAAACAESSDYGWRAAQLDDVSYLRESPPARSFHRGDCEDLAILVLTSGSTGPPKAVELTHHNIVSRTVATAQIRDLGATSCSFNWMPLDHVGGLVMFHLRDVFLACEQVHAPIAWVLEDPLRWLDAVDRYHATTTWAPNFAFALVIDNAARMAEKQWNLSGLRYVMNGGEPIRPPVVRRFLELLSPYGLPSTAMHPGWGMSETASGVVDCRLPDDGGDLTGERHVPVGRPHPGVRVRVVDDDDVPLPTGRTGHLQVTGDPISNGYHRDDAENAKAFTADGWFRSGDLAYVADGMVTVVGRAGETVSDSVVDLQVGEVEAAVEELGLVEPSFTVCRPGRDGTVSIYCCPRPKADAGDITNSIREELASRFGLTTVCVTFVRRDDIAKTGVGKLRRSLADRWTGRWTVL